MTRIWLVAAGIAAAGCATMASADEEAVRARSMAELAQCRITPEALRLVGRPADARTMAELRRVTGAGTVRLVRPGESISRDFATDRLTVLLDARARIESLTCT
jgi:hypothetical protein